MIQILLKKIKIVCIYLLNVIQLRSKDKERLDSFTARPRVIKLEHGEVSLQGFPKELAEELSNYIKSFGKPTILIPSGSDVTELDLSSSPGLPLLPSIEVSFNKFKGEDAIAVKYNKESKQFELVRVVYDTGTKQAYVENVKNIGGNRREAADAFKAAAANTFNDVF